jgi:hypothetical protein
VPFILIRVTFSARKVVRVSLNRCVSLDPLRDYSAAWYEVPTLYMNCDVQVLLTLINFKIHFTYGPNVTVTLILCVSPDRF